MHKYALHVHFYQKEENVGNYNLVHEGWGRIVFFFFGIQWIRVVKEEEKKENKYKL